jgi:DNA-binding IclR family transcriptional regulator
MLQQFVAEDWAIYDPAAHSYTLNAHLPSVGIQAVKHSAVVEQALPILANLAQELETGADLFVPSYNEVASIASADASGATKIHIGAVLPHHCSAAGRAILAFRDSWLEVTLAARLTSYTERTKTDPRDLSAELARVRARGWAMELGETRDDISGVAAPVWTGETVTAAIGVSVPGTFGDVRAVAESVSRAAETLRM